MSPSRRALPLSVPALRKSWPSVFDPEAVKWYYRPWVVILLLFFVLGPFGLPLVYKSPKFGKVWKAILTVLMIFYTVYLVDVTVKAVEQISKDVAQLQAVLR